MNTGVFVLLIFIILFSLTIMGFVGYRSYMNSKLCRTEVIDNSDVINIILKGAEGFANHKNTEKFNDLERIIPNKISKYVVQNNPNEPEWVGKYVAKRLNDLALKGDKLVITMYNREYPTAEISKRLAERWKRLRDNNGIREIGSNENTTAYTVEKDKELRICIREKNHPNKQFEDENTGIFVLLHEMAHMASLTWGHNDEFKDNFAKIVKAAVDLGLYNYEDFTKSPTNYCGTDITYPAYLK